MRGARAREGAVLLGGGGYGGSVAARFAKLAGAKSCGVGAEAGG